MKHPYWSWFPNGLIILRFVAGVLPWLPADWLFTVLFAAGFNREIIWLPLHAYKELS